MELSKKRNKRLLWLDVLRGIAIFFVVFGHLGQPLEDFFIWTSPVKMPLFFAISGFLFSRSSGLKFKHLFLRLAVPYCILTLMPIYFVNALIKGFGIKYITKFLLGWFIPTFFFTSILFRLQVLYLKKTKFILLCSIIIAIIGFYIQEYQWMKIICFRTILISQLFMVIGYISKKYTNTSFNLNLKLLLGNVLLYLLFTFITYKYYPGKCIDVHLSDYYNLIICSILILSGIYIMYEIVRYFETRLINYSLVHIILICFSYMGRFAIVIFLLHILLRSILNRLLGVFYPMDETSWLNCFIYTVLIVSFSTIIGILLDKYCPKILGNFNDKKKR